MASDALRVIETGEIVLGGADCSLRCVHCSHGAYKKAGRYSSPPLAGKERVLAELERELTAGRASKSATLRVSGWDVFEFDGILEVLDLCRRHGKAVEIVSPGLRLADPAFARRVAECRPSVTITYLTPRAEVYGEMTGRTDAKESVEAAISNMKELGIPFQANFVATSRNVADLMGAAEYLFDTAGLEGFNALFFAPDERHAKMGPEVAGLFADYAELGAQLERFADRYAGSDHYASLTYVPPCQLDEALLTRRNLIFRVREHEDPTYPVYRHADCVACAWKGSCFFVSRAYRDARPDMSFDAEKVGRAAEGMRRS